MPVAQIYLSWEHKISLYMSYHKKSSYDIQVRSFVLGDYVAHTFTVQGKKNWFSQ